MQSSLKIGSIMNIPIKLDTSFLLALPISAYFFTINSQPFGFAEVEPPIVRYALSALSALFLFASVLLHELAHSYLAKRYGANIASITLLLFGGVASMEIPKKPGQEAKIAFAGPLTSLIIGSICLFTYSYIISPNPALSQNSIYLIVWILGSMNLMLGIFNFGSAEAQQEVPFLGGHQPDRWGMKAKPRTVANILFKIITFNLY